MNRLFAYGIILLLVVFIVTVKAPRKNEPQVLQTWKSLEKQLKGLVNGALRLLLPMMLRSSDKISTECSLSFTKITFALRKLRTWPFYFHDSSGRPMVGVLSGTFTDLGGYDQCIEQVVPDPPEGYKRLTTKEVLFKGKYCTLKFRMPLPSTRTAFLRRDHPLPVFSNYTSNKNVLRDVSRFAQTFYYTFFRIGLCVPSTCTTDDVVKLAGILSEQILLDANVTGCDMNEEIVMDTEKIAVLVVFAILMTLVTAGTIADCYLDRYIDLTGRISRSIHRFLTAFSLPANINDIFDISAESTHTLDCLEGLKFLSLLWAILGHVYFYFRLDLFSYVESWNEKVKSFSFQIISNAGLSADTFFFISGVLAAYKVTKQNNEGGKMSIHLFIIRRIFRLTPSLMLVIASTFIIPWITTGPYWKETINPIADNCRSNWWTNLFFINNYVGSNNPCLPHTWIVATNFQLHLLIIFVLFLLTRWRKIGYTINAVIVFTSVFVSGYITYTSKYPPTLLAVLAETKERTQYLYDFIFRPYCHVGPACIGMAVGYILIKHNNITIKPVIQLIAWILAIFCNATVLFGIYGWNCGVIPTALASTFYAAIHRTVWSLGLSWLTIACCTGRGGIIAAFLSWKAFTPLSRLTYTTYLVHYLVLMAMIGRFRDNLFFSHITFIRWYIPIVIMSFWFGLLCSLMIERPCLKLGQMLSSKLQKVEFTLPDLTFSDTKNDPLNCRHVSHLNSSSEVKAPEIPTFLMDVS